MSVVTINDAKAATSSIVKALQPVAVILFGSVARNGTGSDLDLLIVTDDNSDKSDNQYLLLHKSLKRFYKNFDIEPFIVSQSLLNEYYFNGSPFLKIISKEGRTLYMKNAVKVWLKQSKEELNVSKYLFKGGFYKGACFHAQQSIEKSIKAGLFKEGWELENTHSIERLIIIGRNYNIKLKLSDEEIVFIDSIYRGRYPAEEGILPLGEPTKEDAEKAVKIADKIFRFMQNTLKN
jgi:HEPN domain-containing protein/predicted nucleotidyltransferase